MLANKLQEKFKSAGTKKRKLENSSSKLLNGDKKKFKKKYGSHSKPITAEEINELKQTDLLSNENVFFLQIEEILKTSKLSEKYKNFIGGWFDQFRTFVSALPSDNDKRSINDLKWINKKVKIPLNTSNVEIPDAMFQFITPKSIELIGAHKLSTSITGQDINVDVSIEMPAQCFQKENYLNLIYHQKKAIYLSHLARKLSDWESVQSLKFTFFHNDQFSPVLVVSPNIELKKNINFLIHLHCERDTFKLNRFVTTTSNVRAALFKDKVSSELVATPHYNSSIVKDLNLRENEQFLEETISLHENVRKSLILLKLWLRSRHLDGGIFGFNSFILTSYAGYLIKMKKLTISMNVYEVLRNFWINLGNSHWDESNKGISLNPTTDNIAQSHQCFEVVFLDSSGFYNICSNLSLGVYLRVRAESMDALNFLNSASANNFRLLFTSKLPIYMHFDHVVNFKHQIINSSKILKRAGNKHYIHDYCANTYPETVKEITKVLRKGLAQRIHSMTPIPIENTFWEITDTCSDPNKTLSLGLILNAKQSIEIVDKGPQADHDDAEEYKRFWGTKSELRRFQDGSITEACVWAPLNATLAKKRAICREIILHLLNYHLDIKADQVNYVADDLDIVYSVDKSAYTFAEGENNSENLTLNVIKTFDEVAKHLRVLDDIPLDISSVLGTSPVFRYSEVQPVLPIATEFYDGKSKIFQSYVVNEAVIQFGVSGKWPDELGAIQRLKAAFCLRIAKGLAEQFKLPTRANVDFIELIKNGYMYRLRIAVQKELLLMKKFIDPKGILKYRDNDDSVKMEKKLMILPKLTVSLHTLYHKFNSFGPAVLIAKRWLYSQLLDPFLWPDECTELLIAHLYEQSNSLATPVQPQTTFFRFLHLLATTNWNEEMIIINFNETLSDKEINELENKFIAKRQSFPSLTIVTSCEQSSCLSIWTKSAPSKEVIARVAVLSKYALQLIGNDVFTVKPIDLKSLYFASFDGYDLIIKLRNTHVPTSHVYDFAKFTKRRILVDSSVPAADFNTSALYLKELREAYDDFALFFFDPCGGDRIAVLWKPSAYELKDFDPSTIYGRKYVKQNGKYVCNFKQIIEDFKIIGKGLVETITESMKSVN